MAPCRCPSRLRPRHLLLVAAAEVVGLALRQMAAGGLAMAVEVAGVALRQTAAAAVSSRAGVTKDVKVFYQGRMTMSIGSLFGRVALVLLLLGFGIDAFAQLPSPVNPQLPGRQAETDLLGEWEDVTWEDTDRGGPAGGGQGEPISDAAIGNYTGIPYNDAGILKGTSWDAALYTVMANYAIRPHPGQFSMRGFVRQIRLQKVIHPDTQNTVAYTLTGGYDSKDRVIWMDGRPHPPDYAEHTWRGFSTGRWERGMLVVTTTHMKTGYLRRNGAPASDDSKMTEYFMRHGDNLIHVSFIEDPAYLEEPLIRTTDFHRARDLHARTGHNEWDNGDEAVGGDKGFIPSFPLGTAHTEYADLLGIPLEAIQGGKETTYPEYRLRLEELMSHPSNTSNGAAR